MCYSTSHAHDMHMRTMHTTYYNHYTTDTSTDVSRAATAQTTFPGTTATRISRGDRDSSFARTDTCSWFTPTQHRVLRAGEPRRSAILQAYLPG